MLQKLFKSSTKATAANTSEIVKQIHNEFNTAADRLLEEAKAIIANETVDEGIELKKKLGFTQSKGINEYNDNKARAASLRNTSNDILYFQTAYPKYKYITEDSISKICAKYGLVFGESGQYKGDIPTKNLLEIADFDMNNIKPGDRRYENSWGEIVGRLAFLSSINRKLTDDDYQSHPVSSFKICAPIKDMDISGHTLKDGYKLERNIPDPVVLFPVRSGYLIISAWGDEASDEIIVNQKNN